MVVLILARHLWCTFTRTLQRRTCVVRRTVVIAVAVVVVLTVAVVVVALQDGLVAFAASAGAAKIRHVVRTPVARRANLMGPYRL